MLLRLTAKAVELGDILFQGFDGDVVIRKQIFQNNEKVIFYLSNNQVLDLAYEEKVLVSRKL